MGPLKQRDPRTTRRWARLTCSARQAGPCTAPQWDGRRALQVRRTGQGGQSCTTRFGLRVSSQTRTWRLQHAWRDVRQPSGPAGPRLDALRGPIWSLQ